MSEPLEQPVAGWYADPLGSPGLRWWDGAKWCGPAAVPASKKTLPGWALACFVVGVAALLLNCLLEVFFGALGVLALAPARFFDSLGTLMSLSMAAFVIAALFSVLPIDYRVRVGVLLLAIAMAAGGWTWLILTAPKAPRPAVQSDVTRTAEFPNGLSIR